MATTKNKFKEPSSFEDAMRELEQLVNDMDNGGLALEQSLAAYQRGAYLVKYCQSQLQAVQEQIKIVENDMARPFDLATGQAK
ncbi:MAG: exodeoxyribonuclease VII small subunit [Formosimonas sp.]